TLTFPRELRLVGDRLLAAPAAELAALRAARLPLDGDPAAQRRLDLPVPARAEIRADGDVRVEVVGADGAVTEVAEVAGPVTAYLDGSLLEMLPAQDAPRTVRLYPEAGSVVRVRGALREAWALDVPWAMPRAVTARAAARRGHRRDMTAEAPSSAAPERQHPLERLAPRAQLPALRRDPVVVEVGVG